MRSITRPPAVAGLPSATVGDAVRIVWWIRRGFWHGIHHGRGAARLRSLLFSVSWWPTGPLLIVSQLVLVAWPRGRYYLSPERDAVLAVIATHKGWSVGDHIAAVPGTGRGRALRSVLISALLPIADAGRITITGTASSPEIAALYFADVPGPVDIRGGLLGGRRLERRSFQ